MLAACPSTEFDARDLKSAGHEPRWTPRVDGSPGWREGVRGVRGSCCKPRLWSGHVTHTWTQGRQDSLVPGDSHCEVGVLPSALPPKEQGSAISPRSPLRDPSLSGGLC